VEQTRGLSCPTNEEHEVGFRISVIQGNYRPKATSMACLYCFQQTMRQSEIVGRMTQTSWFAAYVIGQSTDPHVGQNLLKQRASLPHRDLDLACAYNLGGCQL
jgi:hypothetical protein